ncbi:hypothetical protein F0562_003394 [Nyssa sinensis]|uniref:FAD-binding domain-containing protein n=1 Tax=Nyssa sinensis TaxID=561372 RepID=A0A5J5BVA3_9ASTE|nr:hypothetical protein F0562_003394 [Nyssa sinensis]
MPKSEREMELEEDVVIVGAGIAGLAMAVAMKKVGIRALVLERSEGLRATGAAIILLPNAWLALDVLGVAHKLTSIYASTQKECITNIGDGAIQNVSYIGTDRRGAGPRPVHRKALLEALAEELPINTVRFSSKLTSIEAQKQEGSSTAMIQIEDGTTIRAKVLIGCDGLHSVVASWLGLGAPVNSGRSVVRGIAEFPQGHGLKQEFKQFVDVGKRAGFVPLTNIEVYWFFTIKSTPRGESKTQNPKLIQREVMENFAKDFPPIYLDIVNHTNLSTLTWTPLLFRYPWDVIFGNICRGTITVAGDAMHPMTPDLAQGGSAALEDAVVLGRHIAESLIHNGRLVPGEVAGAMERYVKERRWRVAGLIMGSYLSGWVQEGGSTWWMKFFRDVIFYKLIYSRIVDVMHYDCGKLPNVSSSSSKLDNHSKVY